MNDSPLAAALVRAGVAKDVPKVVATAPTQQRHHKPSRAEQARRFEQAALKRAREDRPPAVGVSQLEGTPETEKTNMRGRVKTVLLKFYFKDSGLIPHGIPVVERQPDYLMDMDHQDKGMKLDLPLEDVVLGRYRKDRIDTGIQTVEIRRPMIADLSGLKAIGLCFAGIHQWKQVRQNESTGSDDVQYVVCICYQRGKQQLTPEGNPFVALVDAAVAALTSQVWQSCFVWDNPDCVTTVNCRTPLKGQEPKERLVVVEKTIQAVPIVEEEPAA